MKRALLLAITILAILPSLLADGKKKKAAVKANYIDSTEIQWMTWDDVQTKMKKEPRKVWVDIYTDWCGWCKVMDKKTYSNKEVIKYMNTKFYAVKFNAEKDDSIRFMGKMYYIPAGEKTNELAVQLMHGELSYPHSIFMDENFINPSPIPSYHPVPEMEMILKFLGENNYKSMKFEQFQKDFKPTWQEGS